MRHFAFLNQEPSFGQSCQRVWFSHKKYDKGFATTNFSFSALALETTGGVSEEGLSFLRQLWRFGARQQNTKLCVYAGRAWARLSCNLQTSVAQAILHRIPTGGNPPVKRTPVEVSWTAPQFKFPATQGWFLFLRLLVHRFRFLLFLFLPVT